jgi:hypothetical protein
MLQIAKELQGRIWSARKGKSLIAEGAEGVRAEDAEGEWSWVVS